MNVPEYILPLIGHLAYFAFLAWLTFVTFMNFIFNPAFALRNRQDYTVSAGWVTAYIILWTIVLTIPTIPALIGV